MSRLREFALKILLRKEKGIMAVIFEVLQDFLNLLPNQRRNLIEGLLALHNEGCIDEVE